MGGGQGAMPHPNTPEVTLCPVELRNVALRMAPRNALKYAIRDPKN